MSRRPTEREIRRALEKLAEKAGEAAVADVGGPGEVKLLVGVELEKIAPDGSEKYIRATKNGENRRIQVVEDVEDLDPEARTVGIDLESLADDWDDHEERD